MKKTLAVMMTVSMLLSTAGVSYADIGMEIRPVEDHLKAVEEELEQVIDEGKAATEKLRKERARKERLENERAAERLREEDSYKEDKGKRALGQRAFYFAGSIGGFAPSADYDDKLGGVWTGGSDMAIDAGVFLSEYMGFEVGLHVYTAETDEVAGLTLEVGTVGLETLITFQSRDAALQPFGGLGFGYYANTLAVKFGGSTVAEESGSGVGLVLKGGVRGFVTDNVFVQGYIKAFSNQQEVDFGGYPDTVNFGGTSYNAGVGVAF